MPLLRLSIKYLANSHIKLNSVKVLYIWSNSLSFRQCITASDNHYLGNSTLGNVLYTPPDSVCTDMIIVERSVGGSVEVR